jgi:hypothetical protein
MFQLLSRIQQPAHKCQCSTEKTRGSRLAARGSLRRKYSTDVPLFRIERAASREPRAAGFLVS